MKLNNKGFAITAVLYGLLILFVILIGSYLTLLGTKKSRLDIITSDIEKDYEFNKEITDIIQPNYPYIAPYTGKYIFENDCVKYLYKGNSYDEDELKQEIADVMNYCILLSHQIGVNPKQIILDKMEISAKKYPIEKAKGKSTKYNKL